MKRLLSTFCAAAIAATMGTAPVAVAGPVSAPQLAVHEAAPVTMVDHRRWRSSRNYRLYDSMRRMDEGRPRAYDYQYYPRRKYSRYYRHRHRSRGGDWIVPFIGGAIVGGILSEATRPTVRSYGGSSAHVAWCYRHYRSYREWDNSFQPYHGPRKPCLSPYY